MVYLIVCEETQTCKIGVAKNPRRRLTQLRCSSPYNLEIYAVISGDIVEERRLHAMFSEYRLEREWFRLCDEIKFYFADNNIDLDEAIKAEANTKPDVVEPEIYYCKLPKPLRDRFTDEEIEVCLEFSDKILQLPNEGSCLIGQITRELTAGSITVKQVADCLNDLYYRNAMVKLNQRINSYFLATAG